jgi:two-component system LytT family sensor kinase
MFNFINHNMKKKSLIIILIHVLYWTPILIGLYIYGIKAPDSYTNLLFENSSLVEFICFYIFYFLLLPSFFYKRKFIAFTIYGIAVICLFSVLGCLILNFTATYNGITMSTTTTFTLFGLSYRITASALSACMLRAFIDWFSGLRYKRQLEKKNLETELALLKAQINPHFLFNTLNNIDVLIEKDAKAASIYLKKLSGILRFMLYESPAEKIALIQEVEYINEYIELQKIRTSNPDFVHFTVTGDTDKVQIAPMLFIPFIENAFKHCTNKKINNAVEITLAVHDKEIDFTCSNAFDQSALPAQERSGLGLELIRNRLNLLYKNHQLNIDKTNNRFSIALSIKPDDN